MKKLLLAVLVFTLSFSSSFGQLYVDGDGNVGVDKQDPVNTRFEVSNDNLAKSAQLINSNTNSEAYNYGIWNSVEGTGSTLYKMGNYNNVETASSGIYQYLYGIKNYINNYSPGHSYGVYNDIKYGTGMKFGVRNYIYQDAASSSHVYGGYNYVKNYGTGNSIGLYSYVYSVGNSIKYGLQTKVKDNTSASQPIYGLNSYVERSSNNVNAYGVYSSVLANQTSSSSSPAYSGYFSISGSGSTKYALYATTNGGTGYAGYFDGDVTVTGSFVEASDESLKEDI